MNKTTKIVTLILSAILLIGCMVGISVSAEDVPAVSVKYKNLAYEGAIQVLYAVDAENVPAGAKVQMYFYDTKDAADPYFIKDEYTDEELIIGGKTYHAFFSKGIAPKDMRKPIYAAPVIVLGDEVVAKGDLVEYSIYTYATNMFAKSPTEEQKALYASLLDYGASVQQVLLDAGDYTAAELEACGGYADQYCGVKVSTRVDDEIVNTDSILYFRPGKNVITAESSYEGAFFTGFFDAKTGEAVGNYGLETDLVLDGPDVLELHKRYFSKVHVDSYDATAMTKASSYVANSYITSNGTYNAIAEVGTEEAPNKALQINHPSATDTGTVQYGYYSSGKAYVFEADMKWLGTDTTLTKDNWQIRFGFVPISRENAGLTENNRFNALNFFTSTAGDALYASNAAGYVGNAPQYAYAKIALNEWTKVRFEYVPVECRDGVYFGVQRAYFNGVLAYELYTGSTYDDTEMASFYLETRYSANAGAWDLLIDNSVCYTVQEDYYGKGLYVNDPDVNTYDGNNANQNNGTVKAGFEGNELLEFVKKDGTGNSVNFLADGIEYGEKYVFETDIRFVDMDAAGHPRNWLGRCGLVSEETSKSAHSTNNDNYIRSNQIGGTPNMGGLLGSSNEAYTAANLKYANYGEFLPGVWYNLRIEYTPTGLNADGFYTGNQKIYVNNELISNLDGIEKYAEKPYNGVTKDNLGLYAFRFGFLSKTAATIQFDNTFIGAIGESEYVRSATFGYKDNLFLTVSASETDCVSEQTVVANPIANETKTAVNNVLKVVTNTDERENKYCQAENTVARTTDGIPAKEHGIYELEFDIAIDPNAALPAANSIFMQFVSHSSGGYVQLYRLTHTGDGNVLFHAETGGKGGGKGGDVGRAKILDGNWHNVKFVYTKNGEDSSLSIYVDGECIGTRNNCYYMTESAVDKSAVVTTVTWRVLKYAPAEGSDATSATYYVDNIGFRYAADLPQN